MTNRTKTNDHKYLFCQNNNSKRECQEKIHDIMFVRAVVNMKNPSLHVKKYWRILSTT